jgi:hypothetical protein
MDGDESEVAMTICFTLVEYQGKMTRASAAFVSSMGYSCRIASAGVCVCGVTFNNIGTTKEKVNMGG